jgi:D-arabinose 1-dehydrogenase-like Zn-dependent alcohol dehydrogenase
MPPAAGRANRSENAMKALVYRGPGSKALEDRPQPQLQAAGDAIVRITRTTICGTDLHILKGDVPAVTPGRILGHEGVGVLDQVGAGVIAFKPGDRVLISCISACGKCEYCRRGMYSHCTTGGWVLGNAIDGTQAEYVRTPHADTSLYPIPEGVDEEALVMLSDILPTGSSAASSTAGGAGLDGGDRRRRPDRSRGAVDGTVLCARRDHHDRPGRQPARGRAPLRRHPPINSGAARLSRRSGP